MFKHSYQAIIDNQTMSPALFAKFKYRLTMTDDELIKTLEEDKLQELLIATVTHSTGPNALLFSLFDNVALSASSVDKEIKPYSFQSYHLHDAFYSKNYIKLHTPPEIVVQKLSGEIGDICDVSWIEKGAQAVARREEKINQAARDIQCLFRGFKDRRVAAEARQLQRKAIATPPESERFIDELHKHSMFKHSAEPTQQPQEFDGLSSNHEHT